MFNSLSKIKWLLKYTNPFVLSMFTIISLGGIYSISGIYKALISKRVIDAATHIEIDKMVHALIVLAIFISVDVAIQIITSQLSVKIYSTMCNNIQKNFYEKIMHIKWSSFNKYHSGDILTRLTSDAEAVTNLLVNIIPSMVSNLILLLGSFVMLLYFDSTLAIFALIFSPVPLIISKFFSVKLKKIYKNLQEKESQYRSFLHETIQNMTIVKAFCLEKSNIGQINSLQQEKLNLAISRNNISIISSTVFSVSSWFIFFLVYSWGAMNLTKGTITFGTIIALIQLISNIKEPFSVIASSIPKIVSTFASAERLIEIEALERDEVDSTYLNMNDVGIEFHNVSFSYNQNKSILKSLNFTIHPSETVALTGSSGEGKTTLIRMLLSLLYPNAGKILITNNAEKLHINAATRKMIAYVPQGNTLFSGTIYDNVKLGNLNASEQEIKEALSSARAWDFINKFPKGLYTVIGEGGLGLSEGQAQRIAIARALIKKAPILILDEATSALDSKTELSVLQSIKNLTPSPTCIIITHRPAALKICNRALKLVNGHITELKNSYSNDADIKLASI